jgi:MoaA/NifB/PqqE/SkfB family radical SAM enzyme
VPVGLFRTAIEDAAAEGYNLAGFSGGEPLMYRPLRELLLHAREHGMFTTVTTNGMLLDRRRLDSLLGAADLVAISLDGTPDSHDRIRGHPRAFATMAKRLPDVRSAGIPFGFIFTLTQHNLDELIWVAEFALTQGAQLLQIHPLEGVGRASEGMMNCVPDETELSYAVLAVARIRELVGDQMRVQLDVTGRETIADDPERVFAGDWPNTTRPLADLLSPLIVEPDGTVAPVEFAFGRELVLGNLRDARLPELAAHWRVEKLPRFRALCRSVQQAATDKAQPAVINWYGRITDAAREGAAVST